jgi:hypothetical protein
VIVCLITLGGCGGSDTTSGTATSAPATSVALSTTTTGANATTPTDRQNAYFYAVLPYDKGVVALKTSTENTFAGKRAFCAALAPLSGEFTKAIGEYRGWGDAQSQIDTLIAASGEATRLQTACASAATEVELDEMMHELATAMTNNDLAVSAVRSKIGLPPLDG